MKLISNLENLSKPILIIMGLILLCVIGILDYFTGYEVSFSLFYIIPIAMLSWITDGKTGIAMAVISAAIWLTADVFAGARYSNSAIYFWNTAIRLGFFLLVVLLLRLGKTLEHERTFARTDYLTGAVNSRFFDELLQMEIDRSNRYQYPLTLAYIDIDNFKAINDLLGHSVGNKVLEKVVTVMQQHLRKTDIVARIGGDEFIILLPQTDMEMAKIAISKMHAILINEILINHWAITFSIGVMTFTTLPYSVDEMLNITDKIMYSVKNNGKNNISYVTDSNSVTV